MARASAVLGERELKAISRIASAAASGASIEDRAEEILGELGELIPIAGAMISSVEPGSGSGRPVTSHGYPVRLVEHLNSRDYYAEVIEPYALPARGWPSRERDLPVDPLSLRCVRDYFVPEGFLQGLISALVTTDGRYVGFVDISDCDYQHPSDAACAVVGYAAPALAAAIDPFRSARSLVSTLDDTCTAFGLVADGPPVRLQGSPDDELVGEGSKLCDSVRRLLDTQQITWAFLWPRSAGGWYRCRVFRCRDSMAVVTVRELESAYDLTARELEVLAYLVDGNSNGTIATELGVTTRTVRAHVQHILEKLDVPTRAAAVGRATREGLFLPMPDGHGFRARAA